jgi:hypothetical protein
VSLFKPSAETGKQLVSKILFWGPQGAGKTHTALSWPSPALVDVETRGRNFAARQQEFSFEHAEIGSLEQLAAVFKELRDGSMASETVVVDSASAIYYRFVEEHTKRTSSGSFVTDWVTVNRRFLACMNFAFSVAGKNVIFTAHAATKLERNGNDFRATGLKFVGDDRFRFAFDYIFRIEPKGDPAKVPAVFHVEKTASPHLKLGAAIQGLDYPKFCEITRGAALQPPAAGEADSTLTGAQYDAIEALAHELKLGQMQLADVLKRCGTHTPIYGKLTSAEAVRVIRALEQRVKGAS